MNRNRIEVEFNFYCDAMVVTLEERARRNVCITLVLTKCESLLNILSFIKYTKGRRLTKENNKKEQANCQNVSILYLYVIHLCSLQGA